MEILECITEQISGNRLPLVGVTVAAVPCPDTPIILSLHWHGFRKQAPVDDAAGEVALASVPSTSLQLNERWRDLLDVDVATLEAGWELGAWDVVRAEYAPCMRPGAAAAEAVDCLRAFGACPVPYRGSDLFVAEAPDMDELIQIAAQSGYLCWQFRPVHGGIWSDVQGDATLNADGTRTPHCPLAPVRPQCEGKRRTVYRFGESSGLGRHSVS
ncbi:MAG: diguanylate cyclase [Betaproteobacteria bacterium]|nr:diguanylate cyclase [Betaproteobacteria bacterium]